MLTEKSDFQGAVSRKTNIQGELPKKGETRTVRVFKGGLQKRGGGVFEDGDCTL